MGAPLQAAPAARASGRWRRRPCLAAAALLLLLALPLALASASPSSASPPPLLLHDDSDGDSDGSVLLLPTESDALAAGLGYLPSTDPAGMILLPRALDALPWPSPPRGGGGGGGLAVLAAGKAAAAAAAAATAATAAATAPTQEERAEAAELARLQGGDEERRPGNSNNGGGGSWALTAIVAGAGRRAAAALVPPKGSRRAPEDARLSPSGGARLVVVPRSSGEAAKEQGAAAEQPEEEEDHEEEESSPFSSSPDPSSSSSSSPSARRDAFAAAVRRDLKRALDDARAAFPDGDFPAPVAAAAAARVLAARTPAELRSRSAALGEAKRRLLGYSGFASPCGPSCAPGACLPAVNPYTYAQSGSPGYLPGPFSGTGGHMYLKHYNGNGVVGLYSCRRCVNDCYDQKPYPNTNVQMCVCKPGCGIVRGAFVPLCDRGSEGDWVRDEQVRIRNGEAGAYRGSILDTPIPLVGRATEGIVVTPADRAAQQAHQSAQLGPNEQQQQQVPSRRGGSGTSTTSTTSNGRSLLYVKSKQQFAAAAGCNYVRQNYCRRCPINYYQQVGNLTSAVCNPCPFDRPTTAGMTGSPTCFVACDPAQAAEAGEDPARPIYAYTREDCVAPDEDDPNANILNDKYPELFPPFSDASASSGGGARGAGGAQGGGKEGEGAAAEASSAAGGRAWDPFSYDGPPMPLRVPRSRWIVEKADGVTEGGGQEEGSGLRLRSGSGGGVGVGGGGDGEEEEEEKEEGRSSRSSRRGERRRRRGWLANPGLGRSDRQED